MLLDKSDFVYSGPWASQIVYANNVTDDECLLVFA